MVSFLLLFISILSLLLHPLNGQSKYIYVDFGRNFEKAEKHCQDTYQTELASIHSQSDQDEATSLCAVDRNCWIGLNRQQGIWSWSDGSSLDIDLWADSEPNGSNGCTILDNFERTNNEGMWFS